MLIQEREDFIKPQTVVANTLNGALNIENLQPKNCMYQLLDTNYMNIGLNSSDISLEEIESFGLELITDLTDIDITVNQISQRTLAYYDHELQVVLLFYLQTALLGAKDKKPNKFSLENIYYKPSTPNLVKRLQTAIDKYSIPYLTKNKSQIYLMVKGQKLELHSFDLNPEPIDFQYMYNLDFIPVHEKIIDSLQNESKGMILLHGIPGSGKTNYIKYLTSQIQDKMFIFVPANMVSELAGPELIQLLMQHSKDKIIVLEDCENYIKDREGIQNNNVISTLLNISDGILSDVLKCQFICTFNMDIQYIDSALLRKGRLICEYYFGELTKEQANNYLESKGIEDRVSKDISLTDLMNLQEEQLVSKKKETRSFGFV